MSEIVSIRADGIIWNTVTGSLSAASTIDFVKNNLPEWDQDPVIWDFSKCSLARVNAEEWRDLLPALHEAAEIRRGVRVALLSKSDLHFGMLKMLEFIARLINYPNLIQAFQSQAEAVAWIKEGSN